MSVTAEVATTQVWLGDESAWPVVVFGPPRLQMRKPPLGEQLEELISRRLPFALCLDIRHIAHVDVASRRRLVDWVHAQGEALDVVAAVATVISTPFHRGLITAVQWQVKPQMPTRAFEALDEARQWLHDRLLTP